MGIEIQGGARIRTVLSRLQGRYPRTLGDQIQNWFIALVFLAPIPGLAIGILEAWWKGTEEIQLGSPLVLWAGILGAVAVCAWAAAFNRAVLVLSPAEIRFEAPRPVLSWSVPTTNLATLRLDKIHGTWVLKVKPRSGRQRKAAIGEDVANRIFYKTS